MLVILNLCANIIDFLTLPPRLLKKVNMRKNKFSSGNAVIITYMRIRDKKST